VLITRESPSVESGPWPTRNLSKPPPVLCWYTMPILIWLLLLCPPGPATTFELEPEFELEL